MLFEIATPNGFADAKCTQRNDIHPVIPSVAWESLAPFVLDCRVHFVSLAMTL